MKIVSLGGGVQSSALVVLAGTGRIEADAAVFANTGDDSEAPWTLNYVRDVLTPWAADHGIPIVEVGAMRHGEPETLAGRIRDTSRALIPIPVRLGSGAPGNRTCTKDFKVIPIARWLRAQGASKDNPATVHIGFSTDEVVRVGRRPSNPYEILSYPLLDLDLSRADCQHLIASTGLPVPRKSACYFCPYSSPRRWAELRRDRPDLFDDAVDIERTLNATRARLGKDPVYMTDRLRPLDEAIPAAQPALFDPDDLIGLDGCDSGHCMT
jgi:hypothetical protein